MDKILHGDSLELLKDMEDNTIDSIVTEPPDRDWETFLFSSLMLL